MATAASWPGATPVTTPLAGLTGGENRPVEFRMSTHDQNFEAGIRLLLKASMDGNPRHEEVLLIGQTPQYLIDHGFPVLPLKIKGATVDKAHFDHGVTKGVLERLGQILLNPKALYRSATVSGAAAVVVTFELKEGCPLLIPLHADKPMGRERVNLVASMYAKEATVEARWQAQGLLLWKPAHK